VSAAPPAANPTTMLIVFLGGKSCVKPVTLKKPNTKQIVMQRQVLLGMGNPLIFFSKHTATAANKKLKLSI
jgi:hypothetical protein